MLFPSHQYGKLGANPRFGAWHFGSAQDILTNLPGTMTNAARVSSLLQVMFSLFTKTQTHLG